MNVIEVEKLNKSFGDVHAVRDLDLTIEQGEIFAVLGPNGAGKTTTLEILEGFIKPDSGRIQVLGYDPHLHERRFKEKIGIVLQETEFEPFLSVEESIRLISSYYPNPLSVDDVLSATGLRDQRRVRPRKLSGGQRRRLDVALGLAGNPQLLFLDEPTTGFDPNARRDAWRMIKDLKKFGKTILLSSHYMDEVEQIADRAAIMMNGSIIAVDTPSRLAQESKTKIGFDVKDLEGFPAELKKELTRVENGFELTTSNSTVALHALTSWSIERNRTLENLSIEKRSLEEAFVALTKGPSD